MGNGAARVGAAVATAGASEVFRFAGTQAVKGIDSATGAKKAREDAKAAGEAQIAEMRRIEGEAAERSANEESSANYSAAQKLARDRQRMLSAKNKGRSSTILTSPLGVTSGGTAPGKTILGV